MIKAPSVSKVYILINGKPFPTNDPVQWGRWFENADEERRVSSYRIGPIFVSTVFLALDHSFGGGPPLLYETMIFGGWENGHQKRYSTVEEARAGHKKALRRVWLTLPLYPFAKVRKWLRGY